MTPDLETLAAGLSEAEPCEMCGGYGGLPAGGYICCGGSQWECGGPGCAGPIDLRYLDQCPQCKGSGLQLRTYLESRTRGEGE